MMGADGQDAPQPAPEGPVRVPDHVAFRESAGGTLLLNLMTGKTHAVDPVGGRVLAVLRRSGTLEDGIRRLAEEFGQPEERIAGDVERLLRALRDRGLVELDER